MNNLRTYQTIKDRRDALSTDSGVLLTHIGTYSLNEEQASTKNCENMIGVTQIPLGVAGPLKIKVADQTHERYIPLATTEGALIASVNRGMKAIYESGGASIIVSRTGVTRGPVFRVNDQAHGREFQEFLETHKQAIQQVAESTSSHLTFLGMTSKAVGNYVFVRFSFDTQDAMGLNMVTIAVSAIASYIYQQVHIECLSISGNYCVDKKPSWQHVLDGRGYTVSAQITLPYQVLSSVLKTTSRNIYDTWLAKCMTGSIVSGSLGFNAHVANVLSALYIATGQDPAHVIEGSSALTTTEIVTTAPDDIVISLSLPSILVGTVGGGTLLETQKEALSLIGVSGGNAGKNAELLAAFVGGACLAGEISLLSSLSQGTLAQAHQQLARGK